MTTVAELERLRDAALAEPVREGEYLRALLTATLYAHCPISDDSGRLRLVTFTRPDGVTVIPVFTDEAKADEATGATVKTVAMVGQTLLEATRGATLMLDPNDVSMTLYPEEVAALLTDGTAAVAPVAFDAPAMAFFAPHPQRDAWLLDLLTAALSPVETVARVHLATARPADAAGEPDRLLVILQVPPRDVERAARAIAVALEGAPKVPWLPIDLTSYDPEDVLSPDLADGVAVASTRDLAVERAARRG